MPQAKYQLGDLWSWNPVCIWINRCQIWKQRKIIFKHLSRHVEKANCLQNRKENESHSLIFNWIHVCNFTVAEMTIYSGSEDHPFIFSHRCVTYTGLMNTKTACYKDMRAQVNTSFCNPRSRPATGLVPCNTQPCPTRWDLRSILSLEVVTEF